MPVTVVQNDSDRISQDRLKKLESILSGDASIALHLQFLIRTNKADLQILKNTKVRTFSRVPLMCCSLTFCNGTVQLKMLQCHLCVVAV